MGQFSSLKKVRIIDTIFKIFVYCGAFITLIPLFLILYFILTQGINYMTPYFFITDAPPPVGDSEFFIMNSNQRIQAIGGIRNSLVGMFCIVSIAALIAIPFGISVAVFASEHKKHKLSKLTLLCVDALQGIPSIIFGIIANLWVVLTFKSYSALAGSTALALMMLPIIIKSSYETLILIPTSLKQSALALGVPYSRVLFKVVLPSAAGGISSGSLLGISRILGETAPLLFTAFGTPFFTLDMTKPMETVAMQIYKNASSPNYNLIRNAWSASLALVMLTLILNLIVKPTIDKMKIKF